MFNKALYGLKTSAARWNESLSGTLRRMGYGVSKADGDLWFIDACTHYEYIAVYVYDLLFVCRDPGSMVRKFRDLYTMKGICFPDFYLGADVCRVKAPWETS